MGRNRNTSRARPKQSPLKIQITESPPKKRAVSNNNQADSGAESPTEQRSKRVKTGRKSKKRKRVSESESVADQLPVIHTAGYVAKELARNHDDEGHDWFGTSPVPINFSSEKGPVSTPVASEDDEEIKVGLHGHPERIGNGSEAQTEKTLQMVFNKVKELEHAVTTDAARVIKKIGGARKEIAAVEQRRQIDEARATIRYEVLFNGLKKVSHDVNDMIQRQIKSSLPTEDTVQEEDVAATPATARTPRGRTTGIRAPTPRTDRSNKNGQNDKGAEAKKETARLNMERCLGIYTAQMSQSKDIEEVKQLGALCVKYAEDLMKTYV